MVVLENPHRLDPPKPPEPKQLTRKETEKIIAKKYPNRRAKQKRESSSVEVSLHNVKEIQTLGKVRIHFVIHLLFYSTPAIEKATTQN